MGNENTDKTNKGNDPVENGLSSSSFTSTEQNEPIKFKDYDEQNNYRMFHDQPISFKYDGFSEYLNDATNTYVQSNNEFEYNKAKEGGEKYVDIDDYHQTKINMVKMVQQLDARGLLKKTANGYYVTDANIRAKLEKEPMFQRSLTELEAYSNQYTENRKDAMQGTADDSIGPSEAKLLDARIKKRIVDKYNKKYHPVTPPVKPTTKIEETKAGDSMVVADNTSKAPTANAGTVTPEVKDINMNVLTARMGFGSKGEVKSEDGEDSPIFGDKISDLDKAYIIAAGVDLSSVIAGLIPGAHIASAAIGFGSTIATAAIDYNNPDMDGWDVAGNFAFGAALDFMSLGGGKVLKGAKVLRGLTPVMKRIAPIVRGGLLTWTVGSGTNAILEAKDRELWQDVLNKDVADWDAQDFMYAIQATMFVLGSGKSMARAANTGMSKNWAATRTEITPSKTVKPAAVNDPTTTITRNKVPAHLDVLGNKSIQKKTAGTKRLPLDGSPSNKKLIPDNAKLSYENPTGPKISLTPKPGVGKVRTFIGNTAKRFEGNYTDGVKIKGKYYGGEAAGTKLVDDGLTKLTNTVGGKKVSTLREIDNQKLVVKNVKTPKSTKKVDAKVDKTGKAIDMSESVGVDAKSKLVSKNKTKRSQKKEVQKLETQKIGLEADYKKVIGDKSKPTPINEVEDVYKKSAELKTKYDKVEKDLKSANEKLFKTTSEAKDAAIAVVGNKKRTAHFKKKMKEHEVELATLKKDVDAEKVKLDKMIKSREVERALSNRQKAQKKVDEIKKVLATAKTVDNKKVVAVKEAELKTAEADLKVYSKWYRKIRSKQQEVAYKLQDKVSYLDGFLSTIAGDIRSLKETSTDMPATNIKLGKRRRVSGDNLKPGQVSGFSKEDYKKAEKQIQGQILQKSKQDKKKKGKKQMGGKLTKRHMKFQSGDKIPVDYLTDVTKKIMYRANNYNVDFNADGFRYSRNYDKDWDYKTDPKTHETWVSKKGQDNWTKVGNDKQNANASTFDTQSRDETGGKVNESLTYRRVFGDVKAKSAENKTSGGETSKEVLTPYTGKATVPGDDSNSVRVANGNNTDCVARGGTVNVFTGECDMPIEQSVEEEVTTQPKVTDTGVITDKEDPVVNPADTMKTAMDDCVAAGKKWDPITMTCGGIGQPPVGKQQALVSKKVMPIAPGFTSTRRNGWEKAGSALAEMPWGSLYNMATLNRKTPQFTSTYNPIQPTTLVGKKVLNRAGFEQQKAMLEKPAFNVKSSDLMAKSQLQKRNLNITNKSMGQLYAENAEYVRGTEDFNVDIGNKNRISHAEARNENATRLTARNDKDAANRAANAGKEQNRKDQILGNFFGNVQNMGKQAIAANTEDKYMDNIRQENHYNTWRGEHADITDDEAGNAYAKINGINPNDSTWKDFMQKSKWQAERDRKRYKDSEYRTSSIS